MNNLDNQLHQHLTQLGIKHNLPPYTHIHNNNHAITDKQYFFAKLWTNPKSLQIESETAQHLSYAPTPLHTTITQIGNQHLYVSKYIPTIPLTPKTITHQDIKTILKQLTQIHQLPPTTYTNPRKLSETLNLTTQRLNNPNLTPTQHAQLTQLINTYIKPYITKYENSPIYIHSDLKLDNILKTPTGQIHVIDYESVKPSPVEADLASLYQDLYQTLNDKHSIETYNQFYKEYKTYYPNFNQTIFEESILFKNTLTTTAAINFNPQILDTRINIMLNALQTNTLPPYLPPIF